MIISELELENFRCFERQDFEFPRGVIGILGPNGSGKSTILEAISWALYGSSTLRTTREDLRFDGASESADCRVTMKFRFAEEVYELERKMTGKSMAPKAYIKDSENTLAESFQGVTQYVEEDLLGMKESSFFRSVFSKQNEVRELSTGGSEERRQLFARLLDIDRIKAARREVDADARNRRQRAEALEEQLGDLEEMEESLRDREEEKEKLTEKVESLRDQLDGLGKKIDRSEDEFQRLQERKDRLNELEKRRENLRATVENYGDNIDERQDELEKLRKKKDKAKELEGIAKRYEELEKKKAELEDKKDRYRDRKDLESSLESKEEDLRTEQKRLDDRIEKLKQLEEVPGKLEAKKKKKKEVDEKTTDLKTKIAEIESSVASHREELEELRGKLEDVEELGTEGECPVCKRPLDDDYDTVLNHYREDIESAEESIESLREAKKEFLKDLEDAEGRKEELEKSIDSLEEKDRRRTSLMDRKEDLVQRVENLKEQRDKLKEKLEDCEEIDYDEDDYVETKRELNKLEEDYDRYRSLLAETGQIGEVEAKLKDLRSKLEEARSELDDVETKIDDVQFDGEEFDELKENLKELREEKDGLQNRYREKSEELTGLKTEIDHLKADVEKEKERREKLEVLQEEKHLFDRVSSYFDQFRLDLLNRVRPVLSRRSSDLLERTTDGRYRKLTIDEDYLVRVYEDGIAYPLNRFSGGETDLANLCLRVAISELVARRSGRPINFIVLDEIFGSQDRQRRQNILRALRNLDDLFGQIFLITHSEEVKDRLEKVVLLSRESHGTTSVQTLF